MYEKNFTIPFIRRLHTALEEQWTFIMEKAKDIQLTGEKDVVFWSKTPKKQFTTKSCYELLESSSFRPNYKWIWKAKLPLKIQIFMWQVMQNAILTHDNTKKKGNGWVS